MLKAETIVYPVHNGLYVNLTNRCSCACTFCIRQTATGVGKNGEGADNVLWLEHEPSFEEVMEAFDKQDMSAYKEVVSADSESQHARSKPSNRSQPK